MEPLLHDLHGRWWVAGTPDSVVAGRLTVKADGETRLEVGGHLAQLSDTIAVIHGEAEGKPVTLLRAFAVHTRGGMGGGDHFQRLHVSRCFIGAHFLPEEKVFTSARVQLENLPTFLSAPGIERGEVRPELGFSSTVREYRSEEAESDGWKFRVRSIPQYFGVETTHATQTVSTEITPYLFVTPPEPVAAEGVDEAIMHLSDLMTLASGEPSGLISEMLILRRAGMEPDDLVMVDAYGKRTHTAVPDRVGPTHGRFRFTCDDAPFEVLIPSWLRLRREANTACNVFFGLQYSRPGYTETRLLLSATAAESLETTFSTLATSMPAQRFEALRERVLNAAVDEAERSWLRAKIRNGPTYRDRLAELVSTPDQLARAIVIDDADQWVRNLVTARNALAHTGNYEGGTNMFDLELQTVGLLTLVLMHRLDLRPEVQQRAASLLRRYA